MNWVSPMRDTCQCSVPSFAKDKAPQAGARPVGRAALAQH